MATLNPKQVAKQVRTACIDTWGKRRGWILAVSLILLVFAIILTLVWTGKLETGFGEYTPSTPGTQRAKTLWDLMELFLVPVVLAGGAAWFSSTQNRREREAEEKRDQLQRDIEADRSREATLQSYLDRMTELLKEGLREAEPDDEKRHIARARTLAALRQLDGHRKGILLQFLHDSRLILGPSEKQLIQAPWCVQPRSSIAALVDLEHADLSHAHLESANLRSVSLAHVDLTGANLRMADLHFSDLQQANMTGADLRGANLFWSNLVGANLSNTDLRETTLWHCCLHEAILDDKTKIDAKWRLVRELSSKRSEAGSPEPQTRDLHGLDLSYTCLVRADLQGADLHGADIIGSQLQMAHLENADLRKANIGGCNLKGAHLSGADLTAANMQSVTWDEADLKNAVVTDEQFAQTWSCKGTIMPDGTVHA